MSNKPTATYLWLDLETSGLNPHRDVILECAALATDSQLRLVAPKQNVDMVLWADNLAYDRADEFVQQMHTSNGLWEECLQSQHHERHLGDALLRLVDHFEWTDKKPILAGATVHFDRGFLRVDLPDFESRLHHRHLDVSSLKMAFRDAANKPFTKAEAHRAMADVQESLGQARELYSLIGGLGEVAA